MTKATEDVFVYLVKMPGRAKEMVFPNEDGTYTVFISDKLSNDGQLRAYNHALKHIQQKDFNKYDVQQIETDVRKDDILKCTETNPIPADKYIKELKRIQRKRRKIQKELAEYESRARFLFDHVDPVAAAEYKKLYGDDL